MKKFKYTWDDTCYILHMQMTKNDNNEYHANILREFKEGKALNENERISGKMQSHRFIVSRSHPDEIGFELGYHDNLKLEAFKIDDRAYYPTESFFVG